jgi:adenosylcobyric acid synthase
MKLSHKAKAIAVLGTGSDVGKSVIVAGLCRLLHRAGVRVVPFKAQNMSLNSSVTPEGGEIGRAQALQAEACGLPPHVDMNPILLKPESDHCAQVMVHGKVFARLDASSYFDGRRLFARAIHESYERLAGEYDVVIIEGAGSAAEVNLRDRDLVNWPVVEQADAQVMLVADIDRGGVFAQVIGTLDLLSPAERARVRGVIINRFRGDASLFADGVTFLERRTGIPVLGVIPFMRDLTLDQEDGLDPHSRRSVEFTPDHVNIAVVLLPHMSNVTDFNPLIHEPDVKLRYVSSPRQLVGADVVMIPGSKNTQADLGYVREKQFVPVVDAHVQGAGELVGICGGYQMLGRRIVDPYGVEGGGATSGLGYLKVDTHLLQHKLTTRVEANPMEWLDTDSVMIRGYQVHMGVTSRLDERPCFRLLPQTDRGIGVPQGDGKDDVDYDGAVRHDGLVWGTYIHGLFDQPGFRRMWLNRARVRKGLSPLPIQVSNNVTKQLADELDRWAGHIKAHLNLTSLLNSFQ